MKTKQIAATVVAFALLLMPMAIAQENSTNESGLGGYYSNRPDPDLPDVDDNHTSLGLNTRSTQENGTNNTGTSQDDAERFKAGAGPDSGFDTRTNTTVGVQTTTTTTSVNQTSETSGTLSSMHDALVQVRTEARSSLTALQQCRADTQSANCDSLESDFRVRAPAMIMTSIDYLLLALENVQNRVEVSGASADDKEDMREKFESDKADLLDARVQMKAITKDSSDETVKSTLSSARTAWDDAVEHLLEAKAEVYQAELRATLEQERAFAERIENALDNAETNTETDVSAYHDLRDALDDQLDIADRLIGAIGGSGMDMDARIRAARDALLTAHTTLEQLIAEMNGEASAIGTKLNLTDVSGVMNDAYGGEQQ